MKDMEHDWLGSIIAHHIKFHPSDDLQTLITVEEMWRMQWKRETIGTLKDTRCHLGKIVFKEMIWFSLMHPPFWFSMLKPKKATLILLEGKYSRSLLGSLI